MKIQMTNLGHMVSYLESGLLLLSKTIIIVLFEINNLGSLEMRACGNVSATVFLRSLLHALL